MQEKTHHERYEFQNSWQQAKTAAAASNEAVATSCSSEKRYKAENNPGSTS